MESSPKSSGIPANALIQPNGGYLIPGKGGGRQVGAGRPPDEFKKLCQALTCSALEAALSVLDDHKHPAFIGALKWATEHGYGKPKETVEVNAKVELAAVIVIPPEL